MPRRTKLPPTDATTGPGPGPILPPWAVSVGGADRSQTAEAVAFSAGGVLASLDAALRDPGQRVPPGLLAGRLALRAAEATSALEGRRARAAEMRDALLLTPSGAANGPNAASESDLVIVPTGDEQQDADEAIETLAQIEMEARARRRPIPAAILFARTNAAVKSKLERYINGQLREGTRALKAELNRRTAFSSLHNAGGGLRQLDPSEVNGIDKAIANAQAFAAEVIDTLEGVRHAEVA